MMDTLAYPFLAVDVLNPLERYFDRNEVELVKPERREEEEVDAFAIPGFDISSDVPRLPEDGLRVRMQVVNNREHVGLGDLCASAERWSDWVSCLHLRMGLPRWLTAATVSLGIVFVIWLCLVIPHNARKQRIKRLTKAQEAAGALERAYLTAPCDLVKAKLDLPPAYDDIACLHVAVPVVRGEEDEQVVVPRLCQSPV